MPACTPRFRLPGLDAWSSVVPSLRRQAAALATCAALATTATQAAPVAASQFSPTMGQGNAVAFDPQGLSGGWAGSLAGLVDPMTGAPIDLVSIASITIDPLQGTVSGSFELTEALGLGSTLFGLLSGMASQPDLLLAGGQLALDYLVQGGTGVFADASGYGLAFIDFDPTAQPDNYRESGLFVVDVPNAVPEPGALALLVLALLAAASTTKAANARRRSASTP